MRVLLLILGLVWGLYAENFAVVVGINHYKAPVSSVPTLKGACNDAKIFRELLVKNGFKSKNVTLLLEEDATKKGILSALEEVGTKLNKNRGDKFFYFHAGHGSRLTDIKNPYSDLSKTAVLLPYDVNESDVNSFIITQNDLAPHFRAIDKKISFGMLIFDSCYSQFAYRNIDIEDGKEFGVRYYEGKISVDPENFSLLGSSLVYPYHHLVSLASSDAYTTSKEDRKQERGVFSMALEYCLKESSFSTNASLKMCLDRKYTKQVYVFKKPKEIGELETVFTLYHKSQISKTKVHIQTDIPLSRLGKLKDLATFSRAKNGLNDLELLKEGRGYKLISSPDRIIINRFGSVDALRAYLSNYRLIYLKGREGAFLDVNITYNSSKKLDNDCVPTNTDINMTLSATHLKGKKVAIFSLNQEGKLLMIEPNMFYVDFRNGMKVAGETTADVGTEFLKVMIFDKENSLTSIRVNESTGEVLEVGKQIETILRESQRNPFDGVVRRVITSRGCQQ